MPDEPQITIPQGWFPEIKIWTGDADAVFKNSRYGNFYTCDKLYDVWDQLTGPRYDRFPGGNCVTLKPKLDVENTRLPPGAAGSYENYRNATLDAVAAAFAARFTDPDGPGATAVENTTHTFARSRSSFKLWLPYYGRAAWATLAENGSWCEIAPNKPVPCVRLWQSRTEPWTATKLSLTSPGVSEGDYRLLENPSFVLEMERKQPPRQQVTGKAVTLHYTENDTEVTQPFALTKPVINITIGAGSLGEIVLVLIDGEVPVAIRTKDRQLCWAETNNTAHMTPEKPLALTVRWSPPGIYVISGDFLARPWVVQFKKAASADPIYVGRAAVSVSFAGVGGTSFAFAPLRYAKTTGDDTLPLYGRSVARPYSADYYSGKTYGTKWVSPVKIDPETEVADRTMHVSTEIEENATRPEAFRYVLRVKNEDDRRTPYIFTTWVDWLPKLEAASAEYTEITQGIMTVNISPQVENIFKIKRSGSVTFANFGGEWDAKPAQMAVRIHYKRSTDPTDIADEANCIFKGYMIRTKLPRKGIKEKQATFELVDRWQRLADTKIHNSPYYDGVSWFKVFRELAKLAGFDDEDIEIDGALATGSFANFCLPLGPDVLRNPQFKFKFGMSVESCIDEIHKFLRVFITVDPKGKLRVVAPQTVTAQDSYTFYDSLKAMAVGEATTDESGNASVDCNTYAWYSLGPFDYSKDAAVVRNYVVIGGPNWDLNRSFIADFCTAFDIGSIKNPAAFNYIGYTKLYSMSKIYLASRTFRQYMARDILGRVRMPAEDVTWSCYYLPLGMYSKVRFSDDSGTIPADQDFFLVGNEFSFDNKTKSCKSNMHAKLIRGLLSNSLPLEV